ncbi:methylated-DNA--[protein]-cysteine S-methyltransferase [Glutamicibacter sp. JL.03c]|uniref:methylated-DNA--[protein]-cysteine S-methyltransferase n=1 Tax=Glutamicibacter sp. JL.03c TaxID=2984842 RepID=UPI0021F71D83|nr:methylated-DNA--[protein]-cysteine S-methyltransferase [Glutamicibacter sp. JL.03c]UYQ77882.1 methylated-DNA--[protein]-cysteine S-methyltransferase [Glutamicibacter sp. JL.03c]
MTQAKPNSSATVEEAELLAQLGKELRVKAKAADLMDVSYRVIDSPIGSLLLASTPAGLVRVAFESEDHDKILEALSQKLSPRIFEDPSRLDTVVRQLDEYFAGTRHNFDVPLDLKLSTAFRRQVQLELGEIGYGQTWSYSQMAEHIGNPKAVRAVGSACATNPIPIVLPCHRVLRTDGSLGGYLGGLETKSQLLKLENPEFGGAMSTLF